MVELKPCANREGSIYVLVDVVEEVRDKEDNQENNQVEGTLLLNVEEEDKEEMQLVTSPWNV